MVITAQSCAEMARSRQFVTPQGRKTETIVVPGQTYIMEFSAGFQTTSNSEIKCQGTDILIDGLEKTDESKIERIRAQDMSYAAEIRSLSLFLRFKLEVVEGRKDALGKSVVCALNMKEPGLAAPHRVENDTFLFRSSDVIYQYTCKKVFVELVESEFCYQGAPIKQVGKYKFMNLENRMLQEDSPRLPCIQNFPHVLRGIDS